MQNSSGECCKKRAQMPPCSGRRRFPSRIQRYPDRAAASLPVCRFAREGIQLPTLGSSLPISRDSPQPVDRQRRCQAEPDQEQRSGELAGVARLDVAVVTELSAALDNFDVVIDFTAPEATMAHLALCREAGKQMVIGTTGLSEAQRDAIREAGQSSGIVFAPNMSVGVNLCFRLLEIAARVMQDADVEIIEAHHRHILEGRPPPASGQLADRELPLEPVGIDES